MSVVSSCCRFVLLFLFVFIFQTILFSDVTWAIARESTLTLSVNNSNPSINVAAGSFGKTSNETILVRTDNFSGYTLGVMSSSSRNLVNENNVEITSINSAISEATFQTGNTYDGKFGYKPSQYITSSGGVNTVNQNTNFLPIPSTTGDIIDVTSAANSQNNSYTVSFGVKMGAGQPAGDYVYEYVIAVVGNAITYNITYDDNTTGAVSDMPSPNPQVVDIDGGTAVANSYTTLSSAVPTMNNKIFGGWCDVATTVNSTTGNDECSGTTYNAGDQYGIDQTVDGSNITLYAIWLVDPFPTVWSQMGTCIFDGKVNDTDSDPDYIQGRVHGSQCQDYMNDKFIDTGVALYSSTNYSKDYEVHFTIDRYVPTQQAETQSTIFNDKLSTSVTTSPWGGKAPGIVVRRNGSAFEIKSTYGAPTAHEESRAVSKTGTDAYAGTDVRIFRINNVIYTSLDNGSLAELQDYSTFNQQFGITAWFGGYPDNVNCTENCTQAKRFFEGELSNMYIKLGDFDESNYHQIIFDENYGSTPKTTRYLVEYGSSVGTLPKATTRTGWTFEGWWTAASGGVKINTSYTPTANERLYAHWTQSTYEITFDPQNNTGTSTETITAGSALGTAYPSPDPTYTDHVFQGWFTADTGGTQISSATEPSGDTTYYAQWKGTVGLATVANSAISVATDGTATVTVSNAADLEGFSFSSSDTSVATIDSSTGVITPLTAGTTYISITGASSGLTNQIVTVTVTAHYTITFNPHNGVSSWDETIDAGDDLSDVYPATNPTYTNHLFQGWFTADTGGTQISSSTVPSGTTTYHAQWKGTVALATVTNNSISVATDGTATVTVTNAADLEGFTFSSSDTSVATIDASTGVITPLTVGTTNISITGAISNTTNQVVTVTVTQAVAHYTITFNPHNGISSWDETIDAGDDLSDVYPATNPTYTNHIFQGWFTADTGGTQISSSTVPSGTTTYHAQWKGTVALATVANNSISVATDGTATITVTNAADLEGFTFSSSDTSVATIDASTGVITPLTVGTTNISITGTSSNTTNQIVTVTVTAPVPATYTVYFNPHNNTANSSVTVTAGQAIGSNNIPADPTPTGVDEVFMGWYTAASGGTIVDGSTTPAADGETYHAQYKKIVCKLETLDANLHTISNHTYGIIANANNTTQGAPGSGTAYNCDVDYDDTYSAANERFYYVGQDSNNNAVLVAWNSYINGAWAPGTSSDEPLYNYTDALSGLPANVDGAWDNPGLIEQETGKAARFTTRAEVASACGKTLNQMTQTNAVEACDYFMEHSAYDGSGRSALWLMKEGSTQYRIHSGSGNRKIATSTGTSMVRPTIVVPYKLIEKYTEPTPLDVTNAVIGNNDLDVMVGQTLTIQVTNSAALEGYTFSSDDSSIATVNSSTGVVTGVDEGTVDIIMTGTTSGLTKTIEVEVVANPDIPVVFDVSNAATRGYQALSAQWAQNPINLATFNKDTTTINNSTWGDTSELSELQYWTAIRNNFVSNQCFIQTSTANNTASDAVKPLSALSAWTSGSVDCSKPSAYDTNVNAALTVRLNDAQGAVVAYAKADSGVIHNMIPGQTYYWEKTGDSSVYGYVTAVSNGSSTGTRWVDMGVVRNVRDLGGLPVTYTDGNSQTVTGTLAYGRLFRGEKMQNVSASELTNLGITTEYNVGDEYSGDTRLTDYHLNNVIHYDFDYNSGDENNASSNYMKAWTAVTNIMTDIVDTNSTKNIYFHCRVGADRTGTVAYLLEGLLGVPDEQRYEEYGLTNVSGLYDRTRYYKQKASNNAKKFVYMMDYVLTKQDIYNWYMQKPGADSTLIDRFRTAMTVPTQ